MDGKLRSLVPVFLVLAMCPQLFAQGLMIPGVGARNRSLGGTATGNALDASGALFFNPAAMSALKGNEITIGAEIPFVWENTKSSALGASGSTDADVGIFPLSTTSIIFRPESTPDITYGLGMYSAGGLFSNYPGDASNPVLSAPGPGLPGAGPLFSLLALMQFVPAASIQLTDELSIGGGPVVTLANLQLSPASLAPPNDANGDGVFSYPDATGTHPNYGLGFQFGGYYKSQSGINIGASYKSTNWIQQIHVNSRDELGNPLPLAFQLNLPPVYSIGASYEGIEDWTFAGDVRYVDYNTVATLSNSGFNPDGSVRGVGWHSVWAMSLGTQYQVTDATSLQAGWFVTENPIPGSMAAFNIGAPAYYRHLLSMGMSTSLTKAISLDGGYYYAPESKISGPIPGFAGSRVTNSVSSHALMVSMRFKY